MTVVRVMRSGSINQKIFLRAAVVMVALLVVVAIGRLLFSMVVRLCDRLACTQKVLPCVRNKTRREDLVLVR